MKTHPFDTGIYGHCCVGPTALQTTLRYVASCLASGTVCCNVASNLFKSSSSSPVCLQHWWWKVEIRGKVFGFFKKFLAVLRYMCFPWLEGQSSLFVFIQTRIQTRIQYNAAGLSYSTMDSICDSECLSSMTVNFFLQYFPLCEMLGLGPDVKAASYEALILGLLQTS